MGSDVVTDMISILQSFYAFSLTMAHSKQLNANEYVRDDRSG